MASESSASLASLVASRDAVTARVLVGTPATIDVMFVDYNGVPTDVAGPVLVSVTRWDGTVVSTGTATLDETTTGRYTHELDPAAVAQLDWLTATWTAPDRVATSNVEVAGGYLFSSYDARIADRSIRENVERYSDDDIVRCRLVVETECEKICRQAFVPRFGVISVQRSRRSGDLTIPRQCVRSIRSVSVDGVNFTPDELTALTFTLDNGELTLHGSRLRTGRYIVAFEHGWDAPPPDLKRANLIHLLDVLNRDRRGISDRAVSMSSPDGTSTTLAVAGRAGYETGIPDVDAVYARYRPLIPAVA